MKKPRIEDYKRHGDSFPREYLKDMEIWDDDMREDVDAQLFQIYNEIGIDKPENHDKIVDFIAIDVQGAADHDEWHSGDVATAFRRFLESKTEDDE